MKIAHLRHSIRHKLIMQYIHHKNTHQYLLPQLKCVQRYRFCSIVNAILIRNPLTPAYLQTGHTVYKGSMKPKLSQSHMSCLYMGHHYTIPFSKSLNVL